MPGASVTSSGVRPRNTPPAVTSAPAGCERTLTTASGAPSSIGPMRKVLPGSTSTALRHARAPGAFTSSRRSPAGRSSAAGSGIAAAPSTDSVAAAATALASSRPQLGRSGTPIAWRTPRPSTVTRSTASRCRGARNSTVRSPAATSIAPGALPTSAPSTKTLAATPPVSRSSVPGSGSSRTSSRCGSSARTCRRRVASR